MRLEQCLDVRELQINQAGGGLSELYVAFASGKSTEFLIKETFNKLEDVREEYGRTATSLRFHSGLGSS